MSPHELRIWVDERSSRHLLVALVLASAVFLIGTALSTAFWRDWSGTWQEAPFWLRLLIEFDLTAENAFAPWFSSMVLLLVAVAAIACFATAGEHRPGWTRFGWLILGAGFAALSLDELGGLHERLVLPEGRWGQLLWYAPVMLVMPAYMLLFGWDQLRIDRTAFALLLVGVMCLATIPLQEDVEVMAFRSAGPGWERPIYLMLLEEGTELFGMMLILAALTRYAFAARLAKTKKPAELPTLRLNSTSLLFITAAAVAVSLLGALISGRLPGQTPNGGMPQNWFPSALAFVAALIATCGRSW